MALPDQIQFLQIAESVAVDYNFCAFSDLKVEIKPYLETAPMTRLASRTGSVNILVKWDWDDYLNNP